MSLFLNKPLTVTERKPQYLALSVILQNSPLFLKPEQLRQSEIIGRLSSENFIGDGL